MADTSIEWTEKSWNPIVGCSVTSPGCTNCYAMRQAARLERMGNAPHYAGLTQPSKAGAVWTGKMALAPDKTLLAPLCQRKPATYFVNSMGDLFHESVPDEWIDRVFAVMALAPQHTFQVLTKCSARMRAYMNQAGQGEWECDSGQPQIGTWTRIIFEADDIHSERLRMLKPTWPLQNVWLGVSAEDQQRADERIPDLLATPAAVRWVSAEPLLEPIDFTSIGRRPEGRNLNGLTGDICSDILESGDQFDGRLDAKIDWIVVGGESGPGARAFRYSWARSIIDQCQAANVRCFVKQIGSKPLDDADPESIVFVRDILRNRKGGDPSEWPDDLRVREMPVRAKEHAHG